MKINIASIILAALLAGCSNNSTAPVASSTISSATNAATATNVVTASSAVTASNAIMAITATNNAVSLSSRWSTNSDDFLAPQWSEARQNVYYVLTNPGAQHNLTICLQGQTSLPKSNDPHATVKFECVLYAQYEGQGHAADTIRAYGPERTERYIAYVSNGNRE